HRGFCTGADEAHLLNGRIAGGDALGEVRFRRCGSAEAGRVAGGALDGLDHRRKGMAQNHRAPGTEVVDGSVAVDVVEIGALGTLDERRFAAHGAKGPHGRVHAAGEKTFCACLKSVRTRARGHRGFSIEGVSGLAAAARLAEHKQIDADREAEEQTTERVNPIREPQVTTVSGSGKEGPHNQRENQRDVPEHHPTPALRIKLLRCDTHRSPPSIVEAVPGEERHFQHHESESDGQQVPAPHVIVKKMELKKSDGKADRCNAGNTRRAAPMLEESLIDKFAEKGNSTEGMGHFLSSKRKISSVEQAKTRAKVRASSRLGT